MNEKLNIKLLKIPYYSKRICGIFLCRNTKKVGSKEGIEWNL